MSKIERATWPPLVSVFRWHSSLLASHGLLGSSTRPQKSQKEYVVPLAEIAATSPPGTIFIPWIVMTHDAPGPRYKSLLVALLLDPIATFIGFEVPVF